MPDIRITQSNQINLSHPILDRDLAPQSTDIRGHQSLIARIVAELNPTKAADLLTSEHPGISRIAAKYLRRIITDHKVWSIIDHNLIEGSKEQQLIIYKILSSVHLSKDHPCISHCLRSLNSDDKDIRNAAARVISYRFPDKIYTLFSLADKEGFSEIERLICFSQNQRAILPLLKFHDYPNKDQLHPTFGFLLTPQWLAANYDDNPELISGLSEACGYSEKPLSNKLVPLLKSGFMFVDDAMLAEDDISTLQYRSNQFIRAIIGISVGMPVNSEVSLNIDDKLDRALFLSAARESDRANIDSMRDKDPFNYSNRNDKIIGVCYHAPYRHHKRILIDDGVREAEKMEIPAEAHGAFIVERAATILEISEEPLTELKMYLHGSWKAWKKDNSLSRVPVNFPIKEDCDAPYLKYAVINKEYAKPESTLNYLSKGAASVAKLGLYLNKISILEELTEYEDELRNKTPIIGCELQIPRYSDEALDTLAWKQAFRYFGIPSPRRLEYRDMLELSFNPSISWKIYRAAFNLLMELDLFKKPVEMSLHISIEGDLGGDVRYILFPQQFIRQSTRRPSNDTERWKMIARGMSKGLVCLNREVISHDGKSTPLYRTELRTFGIIIENVDNQLKYNDSFESQLESTQLLSSALISSDPELAAIWHGYRQEIESYTSGLPETFSQLLHTDWYEASGDPYDYSLVPELKIIKLRSKVRELLDSEISSDKLRHDFSEIRDRYVIKIKDYLMD